LFNRHEIKFEVHRRVLWASPEELTALPVPWQNFRGRLAATEVLEKRKGGRIGKGEGSKVKKREETD